MNASDDIERIYALPLERFDLSTRTANCTRNENIKTVGDLASKSALEILRWRSAGQKTLSEIRATLGRVGLKLEGDEFPTGLVDAKFLANLENDPVPLSTQLATAPAAENTIYLASAGPDLLKGLLLPVMNITLSTRARNAIKVTGVMFLGELAQFKVRDIMAIQNAGRRTAREVSTQLQKFGLDLGLKVPDWSRERAQTLYRELHASIDNEKRQRDKQTLDAIAPEPKNLEEELCRITNALENPRNAEMLISLWGWTGKAPRTLESVGQELGLTRERVRQIEARALGKLSKYQFETPYLRKAIGVLRRGVPDLESELASSLPKAGLSCGNFSPRSVRTAAENLGLSWPFDIIGVDETRALAAAGNGENLRRAPAVLRRKTSERGCTNILAFAADLGIAEERVGGMVRFLEMETPVRWLDDDHQWLYSPESRRNRLFNLCSKVLYVCDQIHISDLRRAVSKSRRLAMCPPQRVLGRFVEEFGLGKVEGPLIRAIPGTSPPLAADSAEGKMIAVLHEFGPVMEGENFAEKCVAAGMNATTHYIYRTISPVVCALGRSVYCKVGTDVPPGTVEDIVARRRASPLVSDHGWTTTGKLWFGKELTRQLMTSGGMRTPSFVSDLVQGEWRVKLPDDTEYGSVTCRDVFVWSFRKQLALLGAEPSDLAAFEFDLKAKTVMVRVGGPGLFESLEDPDSAAADDELEGSEAEYA